ncbi:hypothetical protein CQ12_18415 [Bradyrhizobium jicamae]|uniref:Uncharacterized protein n=1 Tax=Bradyrhizobium jicamae TaxID=280332 RepID=A0A0R3L3Q7_9BRAD|nr:hypothetical protein CQ12_18415 [Bradyrhizobium jicamae]
MTDHWPPSSMRVAAPDMQLSGGCSAHTDLHRADTLRPDTRFFGKSAILAGLALPNHEAMAELLEPIILTERMVLQEQGGFLITSIS